MTVGDWINFAGALTDVANLTQAGSLQELTYGLNNLAAQTAMAEQATAAAAAPAAPLSALWRIQYSPEYIEQVRAQCRAIGIVPPKYLETGYSEEAFGSANDAHAWLRNQFSEGALSDLYSAGKVGVPVLTSW